MSGLTKDQLKNELINHGVKLPSPSARKDEYVRLYQKHVASVNKYRGDFSSDEEDLPINDIRTEATETANMVINGLDVTRLDDDELYSRLKDLGETAGPVVDTTRKVYQRRLYVAMGGVLPDTLIFNGDVDQDQYSDSEEEVVEIPAPTRKSTHVESSSKTTFTTTATSATSPLASQISDIRKRVLLASGAANDEEGVTFDPERHTPSPRRSLRTVTSSSSETTTTRKFLDNGSSGLLRSGVGTSIGVMRGGEDGELDTSVTEKPGAMSMCLRLGVKLVLLAIIMVLALYFYQNTPSESPFKAVELLARQAMEAAAEEEGQEEHPAATPQPPSPQEHKVFP